MWDALLEAGKDEGLIPCGLGARDTLRMEAAMPLPVTLSPILVIFGSPRSSMAFFPMKSSSFPILTANFRPVSSGDISSWK